MESVRILLCLKAILVQSWNFSFQQMEGSLIYLLQAYLCKSYENLPFRRHSDFGCY